MTKWRLFGNDPGATHLSSKFRQEQAHRTSKKWRVQHAAVATIFFVFLIILTACGGVPKGVDVATISPIQIRTVSWDHAVGQFRLAFALLDGPEAAEGITAVSLTIVGLDDDSATAVWRGSATGYDDYEVPYWAAYPTIDTAGFWGVEAEISPADGQLIHAEFIIEVIETSGSPPIGALPPASQNKTGATVPELENLSSAKEPNPVFYQLTVAEALKTNQPTVVGFLTPGLCQTKWCAPVLDTLATVRQETGAAVNYIHVEVFDDFQTRTYVPEMAAWGLDTREPWVFVLDRNGRVSAKFSGPLSPRELKGAVAPLLFRRLTIDD